MSRQKQVLLLLPYPLHLAPSQRFRVENFLPLFPAHSIRFHIQSFLDDKTYRQLYEGGNALTKVAGVITGYLKRFAILFTLSKYDFVLIHREAAPLGPPVFEWLIAKVLRKKFIYDFDDAIWIPEGTSGLLRSLKSTWKIKWICRWAYKVAAGNDYLRQYASQFNNHVVLLPTCVDTGNVHNRCKDQLSQTVTIGWTGSHSTIKYLDIIEPVLKRISESLNVPVIVISNKPPSFNFPQLQYIKWSEKWEIDDLLKINIGIMPLEHDTWSEGKCGFKIIQYLSLGIPAVASPVGVNRQLITDGENGYLCETLEEWEQALRRLIADEQLRVRLGAKGRQRIIDQYSVQANEGVFFSLFT